MNKSHGAGVVGLGCSSLPSLCGARSLLAGGVLLGKALLLCLGFPVVVAYTASVGDESAPKLAEHGPRRHNGNLTRPVRVRQHRARFYGVMCAALSRTKSISPGIIRRRNAMVKDVLMRVINPDIILLESETQKVLWM